MNGWGKGLPTERFKGLVDTLLKKKYCKLTLIQFSMDNCSKLWTHL